MEEKDIKSALICLDSLGITEGVSTLEAFTECDPKAFYVSVTQTDDRVIGVCGAPVTTHSTGFLGLYGVDNRYQNRGIGQKLFDLCLQHIGDRNCGLYSLRHKLYIYKYIQGFRVEDHKKRILFTGIPKNIENINVLIDENQEIIEFRKEDKNLLTKIIEYDSKVHKQSRKQLLSLTLSKSDYKTYVLMDKTCDRVLGFGCIRPNIKGVAIIGPVYADNDSIAEILVYNLVKSCQYSQTNGLIYPTINLCQSSHRIARKLALNQEHSWPTIYTKNILPLNPKYIYCLHSINFSL